MQIVFMGTPDFAVGALEALIAQGHEITAVVTQPDKAKGRSGQLQFPPVKECAVKHGIPVFQPRRIKTPEAIEELKKYPADVYIVAAFGQILSQEILDLPKYGCLNDQTLRAEADDQSQYSDTGNDGSHVNSKDRQSCAQDHQKRNIFCQTG